MKKIVTFLFIIFSCNVFSQPTLLSTEMAVPGTTFTYKHVGTFTPIDTAVQGANQTWDYSTVSTTTDPDYVNTIIDPTQTIYGDSFPTANWGILEDGTSYYFFNLNSSNMERVGSYDFTDGYTYYTNTQIEYIFPMGLGVSGVDQSTNVNNGNVSTGTYSFDCIGYGTLMAPGGHTYTNVIMTRVVFDFSIFNIVSFIWYDSNNGMPVFNYIPGDGGFIPEAAIYLNSITSGINATSFASDLRINNPVTTMLNVSLYSENPSELTYDLMNSLGEVVVTGIIEKSQFQQLHLNMEANAAGLYFLTIKDKADPGRSRTVNVVKQ